MAVRGWEPPPPPDGTGGERPGSSATNTKSPGVWFLRPRPTTPYYSSGAAAQTAAAVSDPNSLYNSTYYTPADLEGAYEVLPPGIQAQFQRAAEAGGGRSGSALFARLSREAQRRNVGGGRVSPLDLLAAMQVSAGGAGDGEGSGTGSYTGPVSQVTNLSEIDIRRMANEYAMAAVGREVTDEEFARIRSRVQRAEENNPTRTEGKGAKRRTVSGLSAEARSQIIRDATTNLVTKGLDSTGDLQADARENAEALRAWVRANGVGLTEQAISGYVTQILRGNKQLDDVKSELRRTYLTGMFPAWSDKINAGEDPSDFLSPYVSKVRQLLEDDNIDLNDSLVQKATQSIGDDGKPRMLPLYEVERLARKDPRWQYTSNALDLYSRVGDGILRTFGLR